MSAAFGFIQIVLGTSYNNLYPMIDKFLHHLFKSKYHRASIHQRQHVDAECGLHLAVFIQIIEYYAVIVIFFQIQYNAHTLFIGFISEIGDAFNLFIFD